MLRKPLFEFSGACAGCGETPYVKLVSQLFGENAIVANATGCSSIYSGTFPTIPYTTNKDGRGPAWANSLFEDNAEFGFGMRLAVDQNRTTLKSYAEKVMASEQAPADLKAALEKHYLTGMIQKLKRLSKTKLTLKLLLTNTQLNAIVQI